MKYLTVWTLAAIGAAVAGCESSPLKDDFGQSLTLLRENQVYDQRTLFAPSVVSVEGGDPDMLNLGITNMRTYSTDRKEVSKPVLISIGGQGAQ